MQARGTQAFPHLQGEVHVTRGVNNVDTVALPLGGGGGRGDGDTTLLLLHHPVHGGSALVHLTNLVGLAGVVENALGSGGLHRARVRKIHHRIRCVLSCDGAPCDAGLALLTVHAPHRAC